MVQIDIDTYLEDHGLDPGFKDTIQQHYEPLAEHIADVSNHHSACLLVGIQGCQGSGKSTLADFLSRLLSSRYNKNAAVISLDDFYLSPAARAQLSADIHPLLATRGVPGTHDIPLALDTFSALKKLSAGQQLALPRFDKSTDDRVIKGEWPLITGPVDVAIFEGWCVGATKQSESALSEPINTLEANEDTDGLWRQYVNAQLTGPYQTLFRQIDALIVLNAPSFECVYQWRALQEEKLAKKRKATGLSTEKLMSDSELHRFIAHYERISRHCMNTLPQKADWLLHLGADHKITAMIHKNKERI